MLLHTAPITPENLMSASPHSNDLNHLYAALSQPGTLLELGALAACVVAAFLVAWLIRRAFGSIDRNSIMFGQRLVDGVLFPLLLLCLGYLARALLASSTQLVVFKVAIPILLSLLIIRLGVKVLRVAFQKARMVHVLEQTISWLAWIAVILWITGLLPMMLEELDQIAWKVGGTTLSVRTMIEGLVTASLVLIVTLWISSVLEARLLREAIGDELSLRKALSNATRTVLMFVGLLGALSAVGIDLTALSVLGGAVGVGIGFGLQKLAANYVSGFVILAERSMRIGDLVKVDNFEGRVTQINARYTVIRSFGGRESVVPNEMIITNRVENLSLADSQVLQTTIVSVGYDSDVDLVIRLLIEATVAQPRVLKDPQPSVAMSNFGVDGLEFTVAYWLADPENGQMSLRSAVNMAILKSLRENKIEIPFPQRVIHTRAALPA